MTRHTILLLMLTAATGLAADTAKPATPAAEAFQQLKTLVGVWESDTKMGRARVTYELTAGGTVLVEREEFGGKHAMMTMYSVDGDRVLLTHYCMAGNQPRMEAKSFDRAEKQVAFRFVDASGLTNPNAGHMRNATFKLKDADHFDSTWEFWEGGKSKEVETFRYARVK